MNKMVIEEVKKCEYRLLCDIDDICRENKLRYTLCGGTLLGAIRHKGFIPWDDDIDIAMPRPDYNSFIEIVNNENTKMKVICFNSDKKFKDLYAKVYDPKTHIEETSVNRFGFECGVYVDLYPIDGLGDTYESALLQFKKSSIHRELLNAANWKSFKRSKTHAWYYELIRFPFYCITRFINADKLIEKIERTYISNEFDSSRYVAIVSGSYREKEILPYDIYKDYIYIDFENRQFSAIKRYDEYLSNIYGDYMQLPPIEKQVTHHSFKAYYKEGK